MRSKFIYFKSLFFTLVFVLGFDGVSPQISAQGIDVTFGTGNEVPTWSLYSPIYRFSATSGNRFNRAMAIYTEAELNAQGVFPGTAITHVAWEKDGTGGTVTGSDLIFEIWMGSSSRTPPLAALSWTNALIGKTQVLMDSSAVVPTTSGWVTFTLDQPFVYLGGPLEIATQNEITGTSPYSTDKFDWKYTTGFTNYAIGRNGFGSFSTFDLLTSISLGHRPNTRLTVTPPTGTDAAISSFVEPVAACPGVNDVIVALQNVGSDSIQSATVGWSLNGVFQDSVNWTGQINTGDTVHINVGDFTSVASTTYDLEAYVMSTGPGLDSNSSNDTLQLSNFMPSLEGTFTINSANPTAGTNFTDFSDLADALSDFGVCGPVIVNVTAASGPYDERVVFEDVVGTSSVNTITINGNGNTLEFAGTSADRATLTLDGTDYITIDNLNIKAKGLSYGWTLHITGGSDHNTFTNCEFLSSTTSFSTFFANIVMSSSPTSPTLTGASGSYNHFENNYIEGGYYGITVVGASATNMEVGNTFINNELADWRYYGMYVRAQDSMLVYGNDIHRENRTDHTFHRGIHFFTGMKNARIERNTFRDFHTGSGGSSNTSTNYVIYHSSASGSSTEPNVIANNLVYNMTNEGAFYGVYNFNSSDWHYYHNTFVLDPTSSSSSFTRMFYHTFGGNNLEFKNNIIYVDRPGSGVIHAVYLNSAAVDIELEGNAYYIDDISSSSRHLGYYSGNQSTLSDWQSANNNAYDQNSLFDDPNFVDLSNDSLQPQNPLFKAAGINLSSVVPLDFDSVVRPALPDPGAFQFDPPDGPDMTITQFLSPDGDCPGTIDVIAEVTNLGADSVQTITINWSVDNVAQTPVTVTDTFYPGVLFAINLGTFNLTSTASVDLEASIDSIYPGIDIDPLNNTFELLNIRSGLSGTYTIDQLSVPSATNFSSFTDLADALENGICGDVIVNVVSGTGPYNEQVEFEEILNASDTAGVTINGNGNELNFLSTTSGDRYTLALNGTDYMTIDSLRIVALGGGTGEFGWGVWLTNGADNNTIKNCVIEVDTTQTNTNYGGVIMSSSATSATPFGGSPFGNHNTIENNHIIGGYYGITAMANNGNDQGVGNAIRDNMIEAFRLYGVYARAQDSIIIEGNNITRGDRFISGFATFYGIYLTQGFTEAQIFNNRIYGSCDNCDNVTSAQYPIYMTGTSSLVPSTNQNFLYNNMIYQINGDGAFGGIYAFTANYWKIYHNTIAMVEPDASPTSFTRGIYLSGNTPETEVVNNIVYMDRDGGTQHCVFFTGTVGRSDYNALYMENAGGTKYLAASGFATNHVDLADWQAQGFDTNSTSTPAFFIDPANGDYTPGSPTYSQTGDNLLAIVSEDIDGIARTATPDLGALEFVPLPCLGAFDLEIDSLTPYGAFLSWISNETSWQIEWGGVGFTPGSGFGTLVSPVDTNVMYNLTGLTPDTCVDVFVREICGNDSSDWEGPIQICTPYEYDAELMGIENPASLVCGDSVKDIAVRIRNNAGLPIDTLPITVELSGDVTQTINYTHLTTIPPFAEEVIVVDQLNLYNGGNIVIDAWTSLSNDQNISNDTILGYNAAIIPVEPQADGTEVCEGDSFTLFVTKNFPGVTYKWFDSPTDTVPISILDTLPVNIPTQGTYWLEYNDLEDSLLTTTQAGNGQNGNMVDFVILNTLNVYAFDMLPSTSSTTASFEIHYKVGSYQGSEATQADWTLLDTYSNQNVTTDVLHRLELTTPLTLSAGQTYSFYLVRTDANVRYTSTTNEYAVYASNSDLEILEGVGKSHPFGATYRPRMWNGQVVYGSEACSDIRSEISVQIDSIPNASFDATTQSHTVFFENTTTDADSVVWDFAGLGTASGDTASFQFPQTDSFTVCMVAYNHCGSDTVCETIWAENVSVDNFDLFQRLEVFPNPNEGMFTLRFEQELSDKVSIEFMELSGKALHFEQVESVTQFEKTYNREDWAAGVYILRLSNSRGTVTHRVIIN